MTIRHAFTLIELMMVISIMAIAALLVVANLDGIIPEERIKGAAGDIAELMSLARSEAASKRANYGIIYDLDKNSFWMLVPPERSKDALQQRDPQENEEIRTKLMWQELPKDVEFVDVQLGADTTKQSGRVQIEITPLGTASGHIVHLKNEATGQEYSIELNPLTALVTAGPGYREFEEVIDYAP